ncbi:hypothetical protein CV_1835 [Chromobacterium violaceum ATCC 12472]|uniref:Uncharacterized protein n=1 Tax=Chromobacterium violaceum (strain ATCC 12472 / DSM 30191 / JCM 1249 / CCUG 213 / NBRC 12614 / NCIMB 9131 / NCTC 9757 / MK) TaxID=243365 RepID=Q7NWZ4_CHRVO|nr:hypothetical protein CV_1835 [Chromobacterium violaceum ATCC 12472]
MHQHFVQAAAIQHDRAGYQAHAAEAERLVHRLGRRVVRMHRQLQRHQPGQLGGLVQQRLHQAARHPLAAALRPGEHALHRRAMADSGPDIAPQRGDADQFPAAESPQRPLRVAWLDLTLDGLPAQRGDFGGIGVDGRRIVAGRRDADRLVGIGVGGAQQTDRQPAVHRSKRHATSPPRRRLRR